MFLAELFFFVTNCFFCGFLLAAAGAGLGLGLAGVLLAGGVGGGGGAAFLGGGGSFTDLRPSGTRVCVLVTLTVLSLSLMPLEEYTLP